MNEEKYRKISQWFGERPARLTILKILNKLTVYMGYGAYALLLILLAVSMDMRIIRCIIVPAVTFVLATVIRSGINAPRPYEKLSIAPLIAKATKGKSFPSRHTVCIAIIAAAWLYVNIPVGLVLCAVTLITAVIRPIMGVHFPRDTIAGIVFSAVCGIIGFILI